MKKFEIQDEPSKTAIMAGISDIRGVLETYINGQKITFLPKISVLVKTEKRGIHMSRLIESIMMAWLETARAQKIEDIGINILQYILRRKISTEKVEITCEGEYIYGVMEPCTVIIQTTKTGNEVSNLVGVKVTCISACPCALEESKGAHTHTQNVDILAMKENGNAMEILKIIEKYVTPTRELLKRDEEVNTIKKAFENAMFVEDIVRKIEPFVDYVSCLSHESIHKHKAIAISLKKE